MVKTKATTKRVRSQTIGFIELLLFTAKKRAVKVSADVNLCKSVEARRLTLARGDYI